MYDSLTDGIVTLRNFTLHDVAPMVTLANNPKIVINLRDAFPSPYKNTDAINYIEMVLKTTPQQAFAIEWNKQYVGNIGVFPKNDVYRNTGEIGYFIGEPFWNKGIATRAVKIICKYAFSVMGILRIDTGVFSFNIASQKVLTKAGFEKEAVFKNNITKNGQIYDEVRFVLLKEWV